MRMEFNTKFDYHMGNQIFIGSTSTNVSAQLA